MTLWCQDEARFGQKGRVCRRWFARGVRPPGLCDRRCTWAHLFAAVRPATGQGFALVPPEAATAPKQVFLDGVAAQLAPNGHAAVLLDQAGWHGAYGLAVPGNITLVPLPPHAPQPNPVERVWLYLRERHVGHRLLDGHEAVVDACCAAWNRLTPERLRSLTSHPYLRQVNCQARRHEMARLPGIQQVHRRPKRRRRDNVAQPPSWSVWLELRHKAATGARMAWRPAAPR